MRLTIIVEDKFVSVDGKHMLNLDLSNCQIPENVTALQWYNDYGSIEFIGLVQNEEITILPEWASACIIKLRQEQEKLNAPPSDEIVLMQNEEQAKSELFSSDWTQLPSTPLVNKDEWEVYRNALRVIATEPTLNPIWPIKPPVIWASNE